MSTGINYLDETWSPITGCSGKGCKAHCWARDMVNRFPVIHGTYETGNEIYQDRLPISFSKVQFHPDRLDKPLHWKKPRRIGVCFTGDWMDDQVRDEWIGRILAVISDCPQHTFFTLTKQVERLASIRPSMPNLWNGVSITDQPDADRMLSEFLRISGNLWISYEPVIGAVDFSPWLPERCCHIPNATIEHCAPCGAKNSANKRIRLIVLGCESGPKRRPCPQSWMIDVVRQCKAAEVKSYVKQIQRITDNKVVHDINLFPEELQVRQLA